MRDLSAKQTKIVEFIQRFRSEHHYPPTVRDILIGCNISSTSVVDYNLDVLERLEIIRRHSGVSRGIELLGQSDDGGARVPLIGTIAAGAPIPVPGSDTWDAVSSADTVDVPQDLVGGKKDVYALKVKGTSMVDALINDGDIVLLQLANDIEDGGTAAVWLKAEKEATLKRVYREKDRIRLQPANTTMKPIYADPDNVEIQGRLVGVIRKLA